MDQKCIERLKSLGCAIQSGGLNSSDVSLGMMVMPFLAIYETTEDPTEEEMQQILELRQHIAMQFGASKESVDARGANMVTIKKENGRWTFRRLTWRVGPLWHPTVKTLADIQAAM